MASFIWIPEKHTQSVTFSSINIATIFLSTVNDDIKNEFRESLRQLDKLRQEAVSGHHRLTICISSEDALTKYVDQLHHLGNAIPPQKLPTAFIWQNAFNGSNLLNYYTKFYTDYTISFEKMCSLFNLAAVKSRLAAERADSMTEEDLQQATRLFKSGAGIFQYIRHVSHLSSTKEVTTDLYSDTLQAMEKLLLAQAQECIFLKVYNDKKSAGILSKIAKCSADLYETAWKFMKKNYPCSEQFALVMQFKEFAFKGVSQLYQSMDDKEQNRVGDELTRLRLTMVNLQEANKFAKDIQILVLGSHWKEIFDSAEKLSRRRNHENENVFREKLTPVDRLPPILGKLLVKADQPNLPMTQELNLFARVSKDMCVAVP